MVIGTNKVELSWVDPPFPQGVANIWEEKKLVLSPPFLVMQQNPPQLWLIQLGFKILPRAAVCIISLLCINCENSKSVSYMLVLIFYHFRRDLPKHWTGISDKRDHHIVTITPLWLCPPPRVLSPVFGGQACAAATGVPEVRREVPGWLYVVGHI